MHFQEWGQGDPIIALHPLALESTAFAGVARALAAQKLRTLAVDLPGFGLTPAPEGAALTPAVLAEPVVELARSLDRPPLILGMSMGGRVALEAVFIAPELFRGVVLVAPYLPWRTRRYLLRFAERLDPAWAERLPLERAWPLLKWVAETIERAPRLEDDWLARACVRVIYYSSCPATRVAFLSAARELALDPAFGPDGLWDRLRRLELPAAFVWAGRDGLIPSSHADHVAQAVPHAHRMEVACAGHFVNGTHFRCMQHAIATAIARVIDDAEDRGSEEVLRSQAPCLADEKVSSQDEFDPAREAFDTR